MDNPKASGTSNQLLRMKTRGLVWLGVWVVAVVVGGGNLARGQSNLLVNPGFEKPGLNNPPFGCVLNDLPDWSFLVNGGSLCRGGSAQGSYYGSFTPDEFHPGTTPFASMQVPTVPGRRYYLKFASKTGGQTVRFGNDVVNTFTNIGGTNYFLNVPWFYSYCH